MKLFYEKGTLVLQNTGKCRQRLYQQNLQPNDAVPNKLALVKLSDRKYRDYPLTLQSIVVRK